ncbi:hypothetical protein O9929_25800 [Vibrio lentus]|nr:hypothetical protein [Vibrio lentus]
MSINSKQTFYQRQIPLPLFVLVSQQTRPQETIISNGGVVTATAITKMVTTYL